MRALFITTPTNDTLNHINAWPWESSRFMFDPNKIRRDWLMVEEAHRVKPDVIFYIGPHKGQGVPQMPVFRELREVAPTINFVSDASDKPWHLPLAEYRDNGCFDLQVGIDGDPASPIVFVTLTPVNCKAFEGFVERDIHLGFSGNTTGLRTGILGELGSKIWVRIRGDNYADHVNFMQRCKFLLNMSFRGSGNGHHVKGRALEAGWAGCALLEHKDSPLNHWVPETAYFQYETVSDIIRIIENTSEDEIQTTSAALAKIVREKYHPALIYGQILEKVGLVGNSIKITPS